MFLSLYIICHTHKSHNLIFIVQQYVGQQCPPQVKDRATFYLTKCSQARGTCVGEKIFVYPSCHAFRTPASGCFICETSIMYVLLAELLIQPDRVRSLKKTRERRLWIIHFSVALLIVAITQPLFFDRKEMYNYNLDREIVAVIDGNGMIFLAP